MFIGKVQGNLPILILVQHLVLKLKEEVARKVVIKAETYQSLEGDHNQNSGMISLDGIVRKGVTIQNNEGLQRSATTTRSKMMIKQQMQQLMKLKMHYYVV